MRKLLKKLDNPFLLIAEGFVAGAILFLATNAGTVQARANQGPAALQSGVSPGTAR
jgi:hypothetical protein